MTLPSPSAALVTSDGATLIVDAWLYPFLSSFHWSRMWNRPYWHTGRKVPGRLIHRAAVIAASGIASVEGLQVHHRNADTKDNRLANLIPLTAKEHGRLTYLTLTPPSAACWGTTLSRGLWRAQIRVDGRKVYVGTFSTREAAHAAALLAKYGPDHGYGE